LKQTSPIATFSPAAFLADDVSMIVGQLRPPNSREVVSLFGSQPISRTRLREALADAAFAVDGDDLRLFGRRRGRHRIGRDHRLGAQPVVHVRPRNCGLRVGHEQVLQSRIIFRQDGSVNAVW
jgi:hypothetical protein